MLTKSGLACAHLDPNGVLLNTVITRRGGPNDGKEQLTITHTQNPDTQEFMRMHRPRSSQAT